MSFLLAACILLVYVLFVGSICTPCPSPPCWPPTPLAVHALLVYVADGRPFMVGTRRKGRRWFCPVSLPCWSRPCALQWASTALDAAGPLRFGQRAGPSRGGPGKSARARAWGLGVGEDCPAGSPGARRAWSRGSRSADAAVARGGSPPLDARGAEVEPPPPRALFEAERPGKEGVPVCWPAWGGVGATAFAVSGGRPAGPPKGGNRHAGLLLRGGAEPEVRNQSLTNKALFLRSDQLKSDSCSGGKPEGLGLAGGVTMALSKMIPEQGRGEKTRINFKGPAGCRKGLRLREYPLEPAHGRKAL